MKDVLNLRSVARADKIMIRLRDQFAGNVSPAFAAADVALEGLEFAVGQIDLPAPAGFVQQVEMMEILPGPYPMEE